ncbi:MAG: GNAT family N-acetyltransferase [Magnetococcales bacterium]|nr:GNAT family N-acetyltransferase [Magnetococcales bacterium]
MEIVFAAHPEFPRHWSDLTLGHGVLHPFHLPGHLEYAREYFGGGFAECSVVVVEAGKPLLGVLWSVQNRPDGVVELNAFGRPVAYVEAGEIPSGQRQRAFMAVKQQLDTLLQTRSIAVLRYQDPLPGGALTSLGEHLLDMGAVATPVFSSILDLTHGTQPLWGRVRKSYKSLINWGRNHLEIQVAFDPDRFEAFRQLHIQEAGRETRSPRSWELQAGMIQQGEAFMITGELEGTLVTAALFIHNAATCYYGVSASRRDLFDKPLSHAILWRAIEQARQLGCRQFEMGEQLYPNQHNPDRKNLNISQFKRGFGGDTRLSLDLRWSRP